MKIIPIDPSNRRQVKQFLELPFHIYSRTPQWVPPLEMDSRRWLDARRNPFYRSGEAIFLVALTSYGKPVGRLAVLDNQAYNAFNQEHTAFFYLFECVDDQEVAQGLFECGCDWARLRGLDRLFGPKGFTPFDGFGLLVEGFEHRPAFGLPYNLPYYPQLLETARFQPAGDIVSGYLNRDTAFPERMLQFADRIAQRRGLTVTSFKSRRELRAIIPWLREMYNSSLVGGEGMAPLTDAEVKTLADQMLWFADPRLIKIVMKGDQPVGFLFAYPDVSAALQRNRGKLFPFGWLDLLIELRRTQWININGAGMVEGYRGLGGTALLFSEMYRSVKGSRYVHADLVQIGVENEKMQRELRDLGIDFYKTHRMYTRSLQPDDTGGATAKRAIH